jgi:hypothetical protein
VQVPDCDSSKNATKEEYDRTGVRRRQPESSSNQAAAGRRGQDIAEQAVILVLVVGMIRLVGSNANNAFSSVGQFTSV